MSRVPVVNVIICQEETIVDRNFFIEGILDYTKMLKEVIRSRCS